jgi:hypothetical protein
MIRFVDWLLGRVAESSPPRGAGARQFPLGLEVLNDRTMPSASPILEVAHVGHLVGASDPVGVSETHALWTIGEEIPSVRRNFR